MTSIPAGIAAKSAITRQNIALSVIKQNADQQQAVANMIDETLRSAPVSGTRGANVNLQA